ncbi:MAG: DUF1330 domain-containing protein [Gammaproteobacteria bacterium]|nr:DUF1330 domain-containing protein [Gammaproteobacteria bacterium]
MPFEMLVGLHVTDDTKYQEYRAAMKPILKEHGGGFSYDFKVSEVLISETEDKINRVFTIYFADEQQKDAFFSHPEYQKVKQTYFESSVAATTLIAGYEK